MEGKTAHLQKGLNWLEEGMPGTEQIPYKEVKSLVMRSERASTQSCGHPGMQPLRGPSSGDTLRQQRRWGIG